MPSWPVRTTRSRTQSGVTWTAREGISDASVYTIGSLASGATQLIFFDEGTEAFMITVRSPSVDLTLNDAVDPGGPTGGACAGECRLAVGGRLVLQLLVGLPHRRDLRCPRRGRAGWSGCSRTGSRHGRGRGRLPAGPGPAAPTAQAGDATYPPPPRGAPDAGWRPNPVQMNEQLFWNGQRVGRATPLAARSRMGGAHVRPRVTDATPTSDRPSQRPLAASPSPLDMQPSGCLTGIRNQTVA